MRRKIRADPTTQKSQRTFPLVQTADRVDCPIEFVLHADIMEQDLLKPNAQKLKIGIDVMGSDYSPSQLLDALETVSFPPDVEPLFFATKHWLRSSLPFVEATSFIEADERPISACRTKKKSSLFLGLKALGDGEIDLFLSSGNTGAFIMGAKSYVKMLPGHKKPALLALLPTAKDPVAVLDLGGHLEVRAEQLVEFAFLGAAYQKTRIPRKDPLKIGLLNIGKEETKGPKERQIAYQKLKALTNPHFTFIGNVEGRAIFEGEVDVLLTDGFSGNVFLKAAEGLSELLLSRFQKELPSSALSALKNQLYAKEHPGALLAGLKRCALKCHGNTPPRAFAEASLRAASLVKSNFYPSFIHTLSEIFLWKN